MLTIVGLQVSQYMLDPLARRRGGCQLRPGGDH
jgi:hypothetical protein